MAENAKSNNKGGNANIPIPTSPKQAEYIVQAPDGQRYGTNPNPPGSKKSS